ncbi:hypothetical protein lerEdw1_001069 [Lerista edwardsae]|nr:hypothetical protein lerEdw1_001069 [Lerista edwardsae]
MIGLGNRRCEHSLHWWDAGIKEVANVCNQSLMKLVTPEDNETDETKQSSLAEADENLSKQEMASGESRFPQLECLFGQVDVQITPEEINDCGQLTLYRCLDASSDPSFNNTNVFMPSRCLPDFACVSFICSTERIHVTLNLDGIVQVLDCHLCDSNIGMMTRIAVLKWLYHLYIKTPRKASLSLWLGRCSTLEQPRHCGGALGTSGCLPHTLPFGFQMFRHTDSLFPILLKTLSDESDEVILKDLEVLAEIASSPAGQTEDQGPYENSDAQAGQLELHIPTPSKTCQVGSSACEDSPGANLEAPSSPLQSCRALACVPDELMLRCVLALACAGRSWNQVQCFELPSLLLERVMAASLAIALLRHLDRAGPSQHCHHHHHACILSISKHGTGERSKGQDPGCYWQEEIRTVQCLLKRGNLLSFALSGAKGMECSPSTPTMNSYFYKFMINLLRRFSSERKLLETRGAFIIRLAKLPLPPCPLCIIP